MTAIIELVCKILGPIIDLIFKAIGKAEENKKKFSKNVSDFQNIQHTTLQEEEEALEDLKDS